MTRLCKRFGVDDVWPGLVVIGPGDVELGGREDNLGSDRGTNPLRVLGFLVDVLHVLWHVKHVDGAGSVTKDFVRCQEGALHGSLHPVLHTWNGARESGYQDILNELLSLFLVKVLDHLTDVLRKKRKKEKRGKINFSQKTET